MSTKLAQFFLLSFLLKSKDKPPSSSPGIYGRPWPLSENFQKSSPLFSSVLTTQTTNKRKETKNFSLTWWTRRGRRWEVCSGLPAKARPGKVCLLFVVSCQTLSTSSWKRLRGNMESGRQLRGRDVSPSEIQSGFTSGSFDVGLWFRPFLLSSYKSVYETETGGKDGHRCPLGVSSFKTVIKDIDKVFSYNRSKRRCGTFEVRADSRRETRGTLTR